MADIGGIGTIPGSRGNGATGQVLSVRALPQSGTAENNGQVQAEVTYQVLPQGGGESGREGEGRDHLPGGLLARQTITVLQQLSPQEVPGTQTRKEGQISAGSAPADRKVGTDGPESAESASGGRTNTDTAASSAEQQAIDTLSARDAAVRSEEESHQALAGAYAGPIQYDYALGPDGAFYAVSGHVNLSTAGASGAQQASALAALYSASSMAGATSMEDRLSAAAAGRGLTALEAQRQLERTQAIASYGKSANMG
ncbi:putative metalloprotease CJM1_0395 family protein [Radicibacter daui]|uniref:putative metalloprotease CJM1_0395 family protein n=1 Tax=Radicibacter daui TaxID=3064829 RepID=UPI004046A5B8